MLIEDVLDSIGSVAIRLWRPVPVEEPHFFREAGLRSALRPDELEMCDPRFAHCSRKRPFLILRHAGSTTMLHIMQRIEHPAGAIMGVLVENPTAGVTLKTHLARC